MLLYVTILSNMLLLRPRVDLRMHSSDLGLSAKADKHIKCNVKGRIAGKIIRLYPMVRPIK